MQLLTKMVHGLPYISSTNGICEDCVLSKHHREMFEKSKALCVKEPLQLIHSDIVVLLKFPLYLVQSIFLLLLVTLVENHGFIS